MNSEASPKQEMEFQSWQCQKCGELIGWLGRFVFFWMHKCAAATIGKEGES